MSKKEIYDSDVREVLYNSVIGSRKIVKDFLKGLLYIPISFSIAPTVTRLIKNEFKEARNREEFSQSNKGSLKDYLMEAPFQGVGALTTGILINQYTEGAFNFVSEHPYTLAIPLITNILSGAYEIYKSENKGLEKELK